MSDAGRTPDPPQLILAFDYGTRRIGVASADTVTRTARALTTLECTQGIPWPALDKLVAELQPSTLVVGIPHHTDGTPTALTETCREFASSLAQRYGRLVALVDETLSSREAAEQIRAARASGVKRKRATRADLDMIAARILLEQWLTDPGAAETIGRRES
jgi:putative Holliday junction resolvase